MLDPRLVVLDEPSMGLDPKTRKTVFQTVRQMNEAGRTILLVEQNARAGLRLSSHGIVLENGQVRLSGTGQRGPRAPRDRGALPRRRGGAGRSVAKWRHRRGRGPAMTRSLPVMQPIAYLFRPEVLVR